MCFIKCNCDFIFLTDGGKPAEISVVFTNKLIRGGTLIGPTSMIFDVRSVSEGKRYTYVSGKLAQHPVRVLTRYVRIGST